MQEMAVTFQNSDNLYNNRHLKEDHVINYESANITRSKRLNSSTKPSSVIP